MTYESKDQKGKVHPTEQEKSATPVSVEQQKTETVSPFINKKQL